MRASIELGGELVVADGPRLAGEVARKDALKPLFDAIIDPDPEEHPEAREASLGLAAAPSPHRE